MNPTKTCRRCRNELPQNVLNFYRAAENADGLRTACIPCVRAEARERYDANRLNVLQRKRERRTERAAVFASSPQWNAA